MEAKFVLLFCVLCVISRFVGSTEPLDTGVVFPTLETGKTPRLFCVGQKQYPECGHFCCWMSQCHAATSCNPITQAKSWSPCCSPTLQSDSWSPVMKQNEQIGNVQLQLSVPLCKGPGKIWNWQKTRVSYRSLQGSWERIILGQQMFCSEPSTSKAESWLTENSTLQWNWIYMTDLGFPHLAPSPWEAHC